MATRDDPKATRASDAEDQRGQKDTVAQRLAKNAMKGDELRGENAVQRRRNAEAN